MVCRSKISACDSLIARDADLRETRGLRMLWVDATMEAAADAHRIVRAPDPRSKWGYIRLIGYSRSADAVLTVIIRPSDRAGVTAWKTSGADLNAYLQGKEGTS